MGYEWTESLEEWRARWEACGGTLFDGRMIAAKRGTIWEKLSGMFPDGLGKPYPPYARSSCAMWMDVGREECEILGVKINEATLVIIKNSDAADRPIITLPAAERKELLGELKWLRADLIKKAYSFRGTGEIKFGCPACGQHIEMPEGFFYHALKCPTCAHGFLPSKSGVMLPK